MPLEHRFLSEIIAAEYPRLLLSGAAGAAIFFLAFLGTQRIADERLKNILGSGLIAFNTFFICLLLQSSGLPLFLTLLCAIIIITVFRIFAPGLFAERLSAPELRNLSITILLIAFFSMAPLIFGGEFDLLLFLRSSMSLCYLAIPVLLLPKGKRLYLALLFLFLTVHAIPPLYHYYMFGSKMPAGLYFEIMIAPFTEMKEFLAAQLSFSSVISVLFFIVVPMACLRMIKKEGALFHNRKLFNEPWLFVIFLLLLASFGNGNQAKSILYGYYRNFGEYREKLELFNRELASRKERNVKFSGLEDKSPPGTNITYVCVIGEATARNHMSLYSYYRRTSPKLEAMRNELFIFNDVISPHSHTQPSMEKIISFANFDDMNPFYKEGSLIELFRQAGYKTFWLSNQYEMGEFENVTSALAKDADLRLFVNDESEERSCDEKLLPPLRKVLEEKAEKKFIVLHLMGAHADYSKRYPPAYNHFNGTDDIPVRDKPFLAGNAWKLARVNEYDNAVRYNDMIVSEIIAMVKERTSYSYVLYFPDHGEEVYDSRSYFSHQEEDATAFMFEIPFIAWFSGDYRKANQNRIDSFSAYLDRKYQTDDVIHSLIDLSSLRLDRYDARKSIFSAQFREEKRWMSGRDYDSVRVEFEPFAKLLRK